MAHDRDGRKVKPPPGKKPGARLSPEEHELWEHTARSISPIKGKKGRVHKALEEDLAAAPPPRAEAKPVAPKKQPLPPPTSSPSRVQRPPAAPVQLNLERRKTRQLSSGRIEIEARIDLHGMRQSEAHAALVRFLHRAYADGRRWVLVITGKGTPLRTAHDERLEREGEERGVLRRNVPRWLAEPDLSAIIIGFTTAAIRHGGEGALYVHIRKRPGAPGRD